MGKAVLGFNNRYIINYGGHDWAGYGTHESVENETRKWGKQYQGIITNRV